MKRRAANPVSPGSTRSTLLEALDAGTVYEVRIRAVSAVGNGTWSRVQSSSTYTSELCSEFYPNPKINVVTIGKISTLLLQRNCFRSVLCSTTR